MIWHDAMLLLCGVSINQSGTSIAMNRRTILAAVAVGSLGIVGFGWWWIQQPESPLNDLTAADVEWMTGEVFGPDVVLSAVPRTKIPAKYVPFVLDMLRPAKREYPPGWDEDATIGKVTILKRNGHLIELTFPWRGKYPLCYTVNGIFYARNGKYEPVEDIVEDGMRLGYGDESLMLATAICEIHREQTSGKRSEVLMDAMQAFERSSGKRPSRKDAERPSDATDP